MSNIRDVGVLGAGPYGLSVCAHLKSIQGLDVQPFGRPMSFWAEQMPIGMLLRSAHSASNFSSPDDSLSLEAFERSRGKPLDRPIPLKDFVEYGLWFQRAAVRQVDHRRIVCIDRAQNRFKVMLEDETEIYCRRIILAGGIGHFSHVPSEFQHLPSPLAIHSSHLQDPGLFSGKAVAVVGAGQSALESAALLHENGAKVEIIVRAKKIHFLGWSRRIHKLGPLARMLYAPTDVGPPGISRLVAAPHLYRRLLPRALQDNLRDFCRRPAGAHWLRTRLRSIDVKCHRSITSASSAGERVRLTLDDRSQCVLDHVVLGTGYRVDVCKYPFLSQELCSAIEMRHGFPVLNENFESSVPGLYFVGAPSAWSFGPLMFFVAGADFAARTIARQIARIGLH